MHKINVLRQRKKKNKKKKKKKKKKQSNGDFQVFNLRIKYVSYMDVLSYYIHFHCNFQLDYVQLMTKNEKNVQYLIKFNSIESLSRLCSVDDKK